MKDEHPSTPHRIRQPSIDSNSSPGGRSNSSISSSPRSHVFRILGKRGKKKKDSLKMDKDRSTRSTSSSHNVHKLSMKKNDDGAFLRNLRGESTSFDASEGGGVLVQPREYTPYSDADSAFLRAVHGDMSNVATSKNENDASFDDTKPQSSNWSDTDSAFLSAIHGEDKIPDQFHKEEATQQQELSRVDKTKTPPVDEMDHANAAFLGALHAASDTQDNTPKAGGTLVFESKSTPSQNDANSAFLSAMRQSHSLKETADYTSTKQEDSDWNSGSLVLSSVKDTLIDKREDESRSFLMSIQSGQTSDKSPLLNKDEMKVDSDSEDESDEDMEGLLVPSHPYMEKVMLPRPLFFGHRLPPRILEEAKQAAQMYANEQDIDIKQRSLDEAGLTSESFLSESLSKDTDEGSAVTKTTKSTFSTTGGGAKLFETRLLPCARNFEGAMETFGFGLNPFHSNYNSSRGDQETDVDAPEGSHPYVSIYSAVWGDRARAERARSRRKTAKLTGASVWEKNAKDASDCSFDNDDQVISRSNDGSIGIHDTVRSRLASEEANNQFLSQLRKLPDVQDGNDITRDQFSMFACTDISTTDVPTSTVTTNESDLSSRDQFCMFARGDNIGGTFVGSPTMSKKGGTFVSCKPRTAFVSSGHAGSDDDSIEAAEERKSVGLNDNMAAAAAMLAGIEVDIDGDVNVQGIGTPMCNLAAGGGAKAANKFGRPYCNLELTGGCVPRFSCDDPSLPHESDLGVFETKEDEKRTNEHRREKIIIEDMTVPGIMPVVVCPSQCTDADDSQTWNSRVAASVGSSKKANNKVLISMDTKQTECSRIGWWNLPDGFDNSSNAAAVKSRKEFKNEAHSSSPSVKVYPATDNPIPLDVITNLWPSPQVLRSNNISPAQLHSATSSARLMPHLSDRNPNFRHLQIDTTAVGFPKLGGEVEPLFCKLVIYHFEMNNTSPLIDHDTRSSTSSVSSASSNLSRDRCGPVTEALNFDIVQDPEVIESCKRALWPYANENDLGKLPWAIGTGKINDDVILEGSPCGVFPLPSHLHISNLYAVLLVHKVVSDDMNQHPYFKPSRRDKTASTTTQKEDIDLTKLRENAAKSCENHGQLITPIAFGVLPLMQIVGNEESPKVPVTRVVQIPLFRYEQGRGADVILDHILGMLHPRALPKVGKIAAMTRGHAFLVMRYYGFLGLHSIVSKIKMAHKRLVDFSRELQVIRQGDVKYKESDKCPIIDSPYVLPSWHQQYVVEPAPFGGRSIATKPHVVVQETGKAALGANENSVAEYAQELADLPLENAGFEVKSRRSTKSTSSTFDRMLWHTSFCNELICHPQILSRCSKKNIVIKIELRELEWNDNLKIYAAMPTKPSIHNPRRGPWLVEEAFTSCALRSSNPKFLDEFKIKLPLILGNSGRAMGLLFTVYHVHMQKRRRIIQAIARQSKPNSADSDSSLECIAAGLLPLTSVENPTCLLPNGEHDVSISYKVLNLNDSVDPMKLSLSSGHQHRPKTSTSCIGNNVVRHLKSLSWTNDDVVGSFSIDTMSRGDESLNEQQGIRLESLGYPSGTLFLEHMSEVNIEASDIPDRQRAKSSANLTVDHRSVKSDMGFIHESLGSKGTMRTSKSSGNLQQLASMIRTSNSSGNLQQLASDITIASEESPEDNVSKDDLLLKVNIIAFSSVHPQNPILSELFMLSPDQPRCVTTDDFDGLSAWGKHRSEILYRLKPERIPPFNFVGGALAETERKLLDPIVSLSKTSKCPAGDFVPHLLRVITQLMRTMTSGVGEPSILWANPDALIPLRLNAFASLLHVITSASHYMAKTGSRLLDGDTKWNISALSKMLCLVFDEYAMFGGSLEDHVRKENVCTNPKESSSKEIKGSVKLSNAKPLKLARAKTSNVLGVVQKPLIIERYSSEELKPQVFDVDALLESSKLHQSTTEIASDVSSSSKETGFKLDTRNDFMSAMREAVAKENSDEIGGNYRISSPLISPISSTSSSGASHGRKRFFTLPAMATIQETDTEESRVGGLDSGINSQCPVNDEKKGSKLDSDLIVHKNRAKPKQFRVPQVAQIEDAINIDGISSFLDSIPQLSESKEKQPIGDKVVNTTKSKLSLPTEEGTFLTNDDDIETAGTAFLDLISETMGIQNTGKAVGAEERRVGAAHHRKTRSRCSIDWTLPPTDMLLEKDQQIEQQNRTKSATPAVGFSPFLPPDDASSSEDTGYDSLDDVDSKQEDSTEPKSNQKVHPLKRQGKPKRNNSMSTSLDLLVLPDFADRINAMEDDGKPKRWWPYVYEVIIYQWLSLLVEQTKKGDGSSKAVHDSDQSKSALSPIVTKYLSHAAKAARGATIRCAPFLLEIIKQSLGWRIGVMFKNRQLFRDKSIQEDVPQLVKLDSDILVALERLITLLTDASIDSRNFDSFEFRKISIDVNDSVVKFLRDLFAMLDVQTVHRLVMVYFSRFVTKEGKHWHDRDSKTTGLRCSWETTKLRLNAVTLFIRFADFMKVNLPIIEREDWESRTADTSIGSTHRFYNDILEKITRLGVGKITSSDGPIMKEKVAIPQLKPHWLAELCTDICLGATGHADESIQQRASSMLFELFWSISQEGRASGNISIVASVFVPFVPKVLAHIEYLSSLPGKSQLRKDLIPCVLFVLQSAPVGVMKALWRKLAKQAEGKAQQSDSASKYGEINGVEGHKTNSALGDHMSADLSPDIYDMFGLLNLSLSTIEYDCCDDMFESEGNPYWNKEFLLSIDRELEPIITAMDPRMFSIKENSSEMDCEEEQDSTRNSRRWHAHDCSMVIIQSCRQIVRETLGMLKPTDHGIFDENDPNVSSYQQNSLCYDELVLLQSSSLDNVDTNKMVESIHENKRSARKARRLKMETLRFGVSDTVIFVRAATSVYLHAITMRQSDVVVAKTLTAAIEIVKIFGIKVFLNAVGETLQHWIRITLEHCGARRAEVRVDASEFLNLLLRLTWDSYGSFFRIRLPLLAVQTEVMERIVAKATSKYEKEQKSLRLHPVKFSTECAEASLTPLWRTIDRIHYQSASMNLSFKSALARLAVMMKKLFTAYLAVHALNTLSQSEEHVDATRSESNPYVQRMRVSVHRIVSNAAGCSRQLVGTQGSAQFDLTSIQSETVEDSLFNAANVFSSSDLPSHRVAFLEKLAEFHKIRSRYAEEATCRLQIYHTYREASRQHAHIWSSSPFLPWTSNHLGQCGIDEGTRESIVTDIDYENLSVTSGKYLETNPSFRKIFYRAADSVMVRTGDWGGFGGKFLFYGVTLKSEFSSSTPWFTLRQMEDTMTEEAELAGDLFLRAGIVESSRHAWNIATYIYSETFNYARLAKAYGRLSRVVTSKIPVIDTSNQYDMSSQIGRFYKVYFHGGAPDDILHAQGSEGFVYRFPSSFSIKDFASRLETSIRAILPAKSTIDITLDDGSPVVLKTTGKRGSALGGAAGDPIKIKVTPLRPLFKVEDTEKCFRGTPEWFQMKSDEYDNMMETETSENMFLHQRQVSTSSAGNTLSSTGSMSQSIRRTTLLSNFRNSIPQKSFSKQFDKDTLTVETIGVDRFYFTQPAKKDPVRGFKDWLKVPTGNFVERSLRVTELQVEDNFPACVTRQKIIHRAIFTQSPLEAGVEAVSTWCSLLFRTIMATNGLHVLSDIGLIEEGHNIISVAKVLADCIHSSGVKQVGVSFLSIHAQSEDANGESGHYSPYERLTDVEVEKLQTKLARIIVTFLELLHLLIARNRHVILAAVQARKRRGGDAVSITSGSNEGTGSSRFGIHNSAHKYEEGQDDLSTSQFKPGGEIMGKSVTTSKSTSHKVTSSDRTDAAIGIQSELQRGFVSLVRALLPKLLDTINTEVPRWARQCCQENYFSSGLYRQADIPIGDELFFDLNEESSCKDDSSVPVSISRASGQMYQWTGSSSGNSVFGTEVSDGKRSETRSKQ